MSTPRVTFVAGFLALLGATLPAHATEYWSPKSLLGEFFKASKKVSPRAVTLSDAEATEIAKKLGTEPARMQRKFSIYVGEADGKRTGFALLDAEIGLHEPIDFGVRFDERGVVERVEIMAYREAYGEEVRGERFRKQFVGKTAADPVELNKDIKNISGATLSCRHVTDGVRRLLALQAASLKAS